MKIVDFDKMFEEYTQKFLDKNGKKYSVEQIENVQPMLFDKFSKLSIKSLNGKTPETYFDGYGDKLIDVLKKYLREGVSVNDFLISKMVSDVSENALIDCLNANFDGQYLNLICEILRLKGSVKSLNKQVELFLNEQTPPETIDVLIDVLSERADEVSRILIESPSSDAKKIQIAEIVSCCKNHVDVVKEFLKKELIEDSDKLVQLLSYVAKYNDESLLDSLYELIADESIGYVEYKELKLTIEALGGFCETERDFSDDNNYKKIFGLE